MSLIIRDKLIGMIDCNPSDLDLKIHHRTRGWIAWTRRRVPWIWSRVTQRHLFWM